MYLIILFISLYNYFYTILKKVNLEIWELQDSIRSDSSNKSFYSLCNEILNLNDSRYLVKKKINEICCSKLKEQKGYNLRNLDIILNVSDDFLSITIELESGLDIPSFSDDVYALIGSLNLESLTNNSGLSVLSYEDSSKELREHKINYEYDSNNYLDSSWLFNRNLKTENTILLKINKIFYNRE